ncbi:hypothetical protein P7K49_027546 [Saguinus oedipus]|uniref:LIM zinc-binding domain-containing protein n=1 Tax=Saguinus oedipus TaxID=9490 RepID=A0ABQ9U9T3_SAGOE|nr:hypothetical protein P7K49_027546 [Saguinus oedipus]
MLGDSPVGRALCTDLEPESDTFCVLATPTLPRSLQPYQAPPPPIAPPCPALLEKLAPFMLLRSQAASPGQTNGDSSLEVLATRFQGSVRTHTESQSSLRSSYSSPSSFSPRASSPFSPPPPSSPLAGEAAISRRVWCVPQASRQLTACPTRAAREANRAAGGQAHLGSQGLLLLVTGVLLSQRGHASDRGPPVLCPSPAWQCPVARLSPVLLLATPSPPLPRPVPSPLILLTSSLPMAGAGSWSSLESHWGGNGKGAGERAVLRCRLETALQEQLTRMPPSRSGPGSPYALAPRAGAGAGDPLVSEGWGPPGVWPGNSRAGPSWAGLGRAGDSAVLVLPPSPGPGPRLSRPRYQQAPEGRGPSFLAASHPSVNSEGGSLLLDEDSEVFKMLQENREGRVAPRQSSSFRLLQEALEAEERGGTPAFLPSSLSPQSSLPTSRALAPPPKLHTCEKCSTSIANQAVRIQEGRYRHPGCYTCADCGLNLKMRGHFWVGDELYCEKHARQRYSAPTPLSSQA